MTDKYHAWVNAEFLLEKCLVGTLDESQWRKNSFIIIMNNHMNLPSAQVCYNISLVGPLLFIGQWSSFNKEQTNKFYTYTRFCLKKPNEILVYNYWWVHLFCNLEFWVSDVTFSKCLLTLLSWYFGVCIFTYRKCFTARGRV